MTAMFLTLNDVNIAHKRVLIREDFNVPMQNGVIQNDARIRAALPGIQQSLGAQAQVILMSHLGRPEAGHWQAEFSLQPVALYLQELLQTPVQFLKEWPPHLQNLAAQICLLENVRFLNGETENTPALAKQMASLCDVFVMDAFGSAHRAHASTVGVAEYAPVAVAGPLLTAEVKALDRVMHNPQRPVLMIIGGAKISSKLTVLKNLIPKVNILIIGGGMANTFLAAKGQTVGQSLCEPELIPTALQLLDLARQQNCQILLPIDAIVQDGLDKDLPNIQATDQILDIGPRTRQLYAQHIQQAATILWNGPLGVFEDPRYAGGTAHIANAIAYSHAYAVAGGGDTVAAIAQLGLTPKFAYISTGGGAFLEYLEGKVLPGIEVLIAKSKHYAKTN